MSAQKLKVILIAWYCLLLLLSPVIVPFMGYMFFGYMISGYKSNDSDPLYLILGLLPLVLIILTSYKLHQLKRKYAKNELRQTIENDISLENTTLSPESAALKALQHAGSLTLQELSSRTGISEQELLPILNKLIASDKIERSTSMTGVFFREKSISSN